MRCDLCFKDKIGLQPVLPKCPAKVCKGCFYEIDRVIGFLEHYGVTASHQSSFSLPEKSRKSKSRPQKKEVNTPPLKTP